MQPPRPADPPTAEDSPGGSAHVFVSRDIAETQAWLNALLRRDLRLEPLGGDGFEARLSAQSLAGAHIIRAEYPAGMRLKHGGATDDLTVRIVAAGGSLFSAGRQTLAAVPGRGLVLNTGLCESAEYGRGSVHTTFTLPGEEVARILQAAFERPAPGQLDIAGTFDVAAPEGATIVAMMSAIEAGLSGDAPLASAPQAARLLRDALVMLVLARFPHRYASWFERTAAPAPWQIRRAVAFIDAHRDGPLTVQEVADAVGIGLRSLQEGFRKHKHVSPHDYIKQVRLAAVRAELLEPGSTRSIEAIARHWGFVNRGHFALDYRNAFGEQPSQTRRRR
ncbi:MAG: AraC family transcriptional regulator [Bosea sp. (in: a-proteobacteria)]|uniref:helix-turn-helix transcriptional regulator n=1 Tax=Bosea sp. (in: a-proteobacteria) TaxID=1871050 RepID=UPI0025C1BFC0|nr:AraC family transcriptional regulator [Bosea sp. (in: a-proteobacteria)]MDP3602762.1 AraC family transcriptional regulator [Bosea sp. (in: a-proteobacteria)]